jgi:osmoprotectant transport system ATP-binding protein
MQGPSSLRPALEAVGASKDYPDGTHALVDATLRIAHGETVALVGESGSGKSTLLRLFNRMVEPTAGEVQIDGVAARTLDPIALRRRTGYVSQEGGLLPHWRVGRNIELVPRLLGWSRERRQQRARELLSLVGLDPDRHLDRFPHELSGGQRQRVSLARALAADPPVVLLDEPFSAVDALTRQDLHRQFRAVREQLHTTMLLVTHDLAEAFALADRIGVMQAGRLLQVAGRDELLAQPAHPYVRQLLALAAARSEGEES